MPKRPMTDQDLLRALHWRDHDGMMLVDIAKRMGRSKGSIIGALSRIEKDTNATDCGNQNGSMAPMWWKR